MAVLGGSSAARRPIVVLAARRWENRAVYQPDDSAAQCEIAHVSGRPPLKHVSLERGPATSSGSRLALSVSNWLSAGVGGFLPLGAQLFGRLLPEHLTLLASAPSPTSSLGRVKARVAMGTPVPAGEAALQRG